MPDILKDDEIIVQSLALHKVLEGLIHNINTPLNLILGYSQQLKKQYPDVQQLDRIYQAGLQIDDLVRSCTRNMIQRLGKDKRSFDVITWLSDEIKTLNDVLDIKHKIQIVTQLPATEIFVESSPLLLSLFIESLLIFASDKLELFASGTVNIKPVMDDFAVALTITLSNDFDKDDLKLYLTRVQSELEAYAGITSIEFPFAWTCDEAEVLIHLSRQGNQ